MPVNNVVGEKIMGEYNTGGENWRKFDDIIKTVNTSYVSSTRWYWDNTPYRIAVFMSIDEKRKFEERFGMNHVGG